MIKIKYLSSFVNEFGDYKKDILHLLSFFTIIPIKSNTKTKLSKSLYALPLVSLIIGVIAAIPLLTLSLINMPNLIISIITIFTLILVTGALHEDGIADFMDSFGGAKSKNKKIEILSDSNIGSYGTIALILSILTRIIALYLILESSGILSAISALLAVSVLSRTSMLHILATLPAVKKSGLGHSATMPEKNILIFSYSLSILIISLLTIPAFGFLGLFFVISSGILASLLVTSIAFKHLGGQTGDVCGSVQQISEILIYLSLLIII
jgi:adenosylcobinamide-GDP ribazoletransferase